MLGDHPNGWSPAVTLACCTTTHGSSPLAFGRGPRRSRLWVNADTFSSPWHLGPRFLFSAEWLGLRRRVAAGSSLLASPPGQIDPSLGRGSVRAGDCPHPTLCSPEAHGIIVGFIPTLLTD